MLSTLLVYDIPTYTTFLRKFDYCIATYKFKFQGCHESVIFAIIILRITSPLKISIFHELSLPCVLVVHMTLSCITSRQHLYSDKKFHLSELSTSGYHNPLDPYRISVIMRTTMVDSSQSFTNEISRMKNSWMAS